MSQMESLQISEDRKVHLIHSSLHSRGVLAHLKSAVWQQLQTDFNTETEEEDIETSIRNAMQKSGLDVQLKNAVYQEKLRLSLINPLMAMSQTAVHLPKDSLKEPLDYIRSAQHDLEQKLRRSLEKLSKLTGIALYQERAPNESEKLKKKWHSIGSLKHDHSKLTPLYTPKDFLDLLCSIHNPNNSSPERLITSGHLIQVFLTSKSLMHLKQQYSLLHPKNIESISSYQKASKALKSGLFSSAKEVCQAGCPIEHRGTLWSMALGMDSCLPKYIFNFDKLKSHVIKYRLLVDDLLIKDVKKIAANDVEYFVFEDMLHQIFLSFVRDDSITEDEGSVTKITIENATKEVVCVSNGIMPFQGFSMFVAPLCYLYQRTEQLYTIFTMMYKRYFIMLHNVTSNTKGILSLCCLFETLLLSRNPELFQYITSIGSHPLRLVFPWLMSGFSGFLSVEQVLLLWDFVIGYDSLEIISVLAVAVIEFRAKSLFQASSINDVEAILSDLKNLSILPLIQQILFL